MVSVVWFLPLVLALGLLAPIALVAVDDRIDLAVTRVAVTFFGQYVAEESEQKVNQQRRMRAAHVGDTHRSFAARTLLFSTLAGLAGSILGVYVIAGVLAALQLGSDTVASALPPQLSFLAALTDVSSLGVLELFPLLLLSSGTFGAGLGLGAYYGRWIVMDQRAYARAGRIEATLPRTVAFVYALSRSGMSFPKVMTTLAENEDVYGEAARELGVAVREMETLGADPLTAMDRLSNRTPADNMAEFAGNLSSVLGSGRNLSEFLRNQYHRFQDEAESQQEQYLEILSTMAEAYVTVLVAGPLFLITILVVIGLVLSSNTIGLLRLMVYMAIPLATFAFVVYVDSISQGNADGTTDAGGFTDPRKALVAGTLDESETDGDALVGAVAVDTGDEGGDTGGEIGGGGGGGGGTGGTGGGDGAAGTSGDGRSTPDGAAATTDGGTVDGDDGLGGSGGDGGLGSGGDGGLGSGGDGGLGGGGDGRLGGGGLGGDTDVSGDGDGGGLGGGDERYGDGGGHASAADPWQTSRERLAAYDTLSTYLEKLREPSRLVRDNPGVTAYVTLPVALVWIVVRAGTLPLEVFPAIRTLDSPIVEGTVFVLAAYAVAYEYEKRRTRGVEKAVPDFLDRMASVNDAGMSVVESVETLADDDVGALTPELERTWRDMQWGADLVTALHRLKDRVDSVLVTRAVALTTNAVAASGDVAPVLEIAADEARSTQQLRRERRQVMLTYLVVIYVSFFVFLGIVAALTTSFLPAIEGAELGGSLGGSVPGVGGGAGALGGIQNVNTDQYVVLFFHASAIQGIASGVVAGQLGEGNVRDGVKHVTLMLFVTYVAFTLVGA
ncbi:type II secretion system F family protein [Halobaculum sp. MBLA0147]|uniref:type II secretion system F family protein n=1 Tax=Halobaculum sp. MBLA0147 TaxID=3079934 RepID=UPI003523A67E